MSQPENWYWSNTVYDGIATYVVVDVDGEKKIKSYGGDFYVTYADAPSRRNSSTSKGEVCRTTQASVGEARTSRMHSAATTRGEQALTQVRGTDDQALPRPGARGVEAHAGTGRELSHRHETQRPTARDLRRPAC